MVAIKLTVGHVFG